MSAPYNEEQIKSLVRYGMQYGIANFRLNSYVAIASKKDDEGYTRAHNADVESLTVPPMNLAGGIEHLLLNNPGTDVTISSAAIMNNGTIGHIPMLDMVAPVTSPTKVAIQEIFSDLAHFLQRTGVGDLFGPQRLYISGRSYHAYGMLRGPFPYELFKDVVGGILVCDHGQVVDHQWLGFCLARGEFRLRLTAVQEKYTMLPSNIPDPSKVVKFALSSSGILVDKDTVLGPF